MSPQRFDDLPEGTDTERPNPARIYDYFLGGSRNFAADRAAAEAIEAASPGSVRAAIRGNRACLRRMVRWCARQGVEQFLDLGSGIPTVGNVHEIVAQVRRDARTVYVDCEPVALAAARRLLADTTTAMVVDADVRDPVAVLAAAEATGLIDLARPVAITGLALWHFVPDDGVVAAALAAYRAACVPGSYLAMTHAWLGDLPADGISAYNAVTGERLVSRPPERVAAWVSPPGSGWRLVAPGAVGVHMWHPDAEPTEAERASGQGMTAVLAVLAVLGGDGGG